LFSSAFLSHACLLVIVETGVIQETLANVVLQLDANEMSRNSQHHTANQ
jgi:hypothetical protein